MSATPLPAAVPLKFLFCHGGDAAAAAHERRRVRLTCPAALSTVQATVRRWTRGERCELRYTDPEGDDVVVEEAAEWDECVALWLHERANGGGGGGSNALVLRVVLLGGMRSCLRPPSLSVPRPEQAAAAGEVEDPVLGPAARALRVERCRRLRVRVEGDYYRRAAAAQRIQRTWRCVVQKVLKRRRDNYVVAGGGGGGGGGARAGELGQLAGMGFVNEERCAALLEVHGDDVSAVVGDLLRQAPQLGYGRVLHAGSSMLQYVEGVEE